MMICRKQIVLFFFFLTYHEVTSQIGGKKYYLLLQRRTKERGKCPFKILMLNAFVIQRFDLEKIYFML